MLKANFSALDLIEVLSEETSLCYKTVLAIIKGLTNLDQLIKNPPSYVQYASQILKRVELEEMYRQTTYTLNGNRYAEELKQQFETALPVQATPNKGVYDYVICDADSTPERNFAMQADDDPQVICFLKLPSFYKIPTPIGTYTPDFGIIIQRNTGIRETSSKDYWFVIETKGTNDLNDESALTEKERSKINYAIKHFDALGIPAIHYVAPVKDYNEGFKNKPETFND